MRCTLTRSTICISSIAALILSSGTGLHPQNGKKESLAQLELTTEVAASTAEGYPAALRVTLRNVGNLAVTMPLLGSDCHPENGVQLVSFWLSVDEKSGTGGGIGCGMSDRPTLQARVRSQWIQLAPGEFMTTMLRVETPKTLPGTVEYWVEYIPPDATARERADLLQAGYLIPSDKLQTEHRTFAIH